MTLITQIAPINPALSIADGKTHFQIVTGYAKKKIDREKLTFGDAITLCISPDKIATKSLLLNELQENLKATHKQPSEVTIVASNAESDDNYISLQSGEITLPGEENPSNLADILNEAIIKNYISSATRVAFVDVKNTNVDMRDAENTALKKISNQTGLSLYVPSQPIKISDTGTSKPVPSFEISPNETLPTFGDNYLAKTQAALACQSENK